VVRVRCVKKFKSTIHPTRLNFTLAYDKALGFNHNIVQSLCHASTIVKALHNLRGVVNHGSQLLSSVAQTAPHYISHSNTCSSLNRHLPSVIRPSVAPAIYRQNGEVYLACFKKRATVECADMIECYALFCFQ